MSILQFTAPPLPYYINCGFNLSAPGRKHPNRYHMGEFDLLVVMKGCIYIGEEDRHYELTEGHALVLRPDLHHYPTGESLEESSSFWLHFQTTGAWGLANEELTMNPMNTIGIQTFPLQIPQFTLLLQPSKVYENLQHLIDLGKINHQSWARWKQQTIFQEVLQQLGASLELQEDKRPGAAVANQAATYLRTNYSAHITTIELGLSLNFHPVYIARCMQKEFHCSPMEYLMKYRIQQAKLLLQQTDLSISYIGEQVGFNQAAYFTSCFVKDTGLTPRTYRQRFSRSIVK